MANTSVYLVEDFELVRRGLQLVIDKSENLTLVGSASNGRTAVHQAATLRPDVVIMDIGLPDIDGITATAEIKQKSPETRIIILSAHQDLEWVLKAVAAGASAYCLKDSCTSKLDLAIRSVLSGALWLDEKVSGNVVDCVVTQRRSETVKKEQAEIRQMTPELSMREKEVLHGICDGLRNKEIGRRMGISISTVRTHIVHIAEKLQCSSRTEIAMKAHKLGLLA